MEGDFEIKFVIGTEHNNTAVISGLTITGKDGEEILNMRLNDAFIYPDELIKLGKWVDFTGFKLVTEYNP